MSFDDLPPLPPQVNPDAQKYIDRVCALSRAAFKTARGEFDIAYGDDYWQKIDVFVPPAAGQQKLAGAVLHAWRRLGERQQGMDGIHGSAGDGVAVDLRLGQLSACPGGALSGRDGRLF